MLKQVIKIENFARYEVFIIVGALMALGTLLKLLKFYDFSSDWFWLIAGLGLIVEGAISLAKQKKFDSKFKIITKEEYESLNKRRQL